MALDTISERFSMLNFGGISDTLPPPDGTIAKADRFHLLDLYSGIVAVPMTFTLGADTYMLVDQTADEYALSDQRADHYALLDPDEDTYSL